MTLGLQNDCLFQKNRAEQWTRGMRGGAWLKDGGGVPIEQKENRGWRRRISEGIDCGRFDDDSECGITLTIQCVTSG